MPLLQAINAVTGVGGFLVCLPIGVGLYFVLRVFLRRGTGLPAGAGRAELA